MGFLLQTIGIGSIFLIVFLALYFVLILVSNFIQSKKNRVGYIKNSKDIVIFSDTSNHTANSF